MLAKYQNNEDPAGVWAVPEYYKKLDAAMIQKAARTYRSGSNRVQVSLVPEQQK